MSGEPRARVQGGDVTTVAIAKTAVARVSKGKHGVYFAWGAFAKYNGELFVDEHGDDIPGEEFVGASLTLAKSARLGHEHDGTVNGSVPLVFPLTEDIQLALDLTSPHAGLVVGFQPIGELAKSLDAGDDWELSIAGFGEAHAVAASIAKTADGVEVMAKAKHKRTLRNLVLEEISLVKRGAHGAGTRIAIAKRGDGNASTDAALGAARVAFAASMKITKRTPALTSATDGHQHAIYDTDEKDGFTSWDSAMSTPYGGHSHPWVKAADGSISIGEQAGHTHQLATTSTEIAMSQTPDLAKQLADAHALIAKAQARTVVAAGLSADQHAFAKRLTGPALEAFLDAPDADRTARATPVYKSTATGESFFGSDDDRLVTMAKGLDAQVAANAEQAKAAQTATIAKAADKIPHVKGRELLAKAVHGIALTAEERTQALADLATIDASIATATQPIGKGGGDAQPGSALEAYEKGLVEFAKAAKKSPDDVADDFLVTDDGQRLYAAYTAESAAARRR